MALAFSSSGDDVMNREVTAAGSPPSFTNIADEFDISSTPAWICGHRFTRVCTSTTVIHITQYRTLFSYQY